MRSRVVALTIFVAALVGCGGTGTGTLVAGPVAPPAPARFRFGSSFAAYEGASHRVVEQSRVDARMQQAHSVLLYHVTAEISEGDSTLLASFTIDTVLDATAQNILPKEIGSATGTRFSALLSPAGVLSPVAGGDATSTLSGQLARQIEEFFPHVPVDGLQPNSTWTDTTTTNRNEAGAQIAVRAVTEYRSDDWHPDPDGRQVLTVYFERTYELHGSGDQFGQAFTIEGTGTASGVSLLSGEGGFLGSTREDELRGQIVLVSIGETTQMRQTQSDTIRVRQ